MQQQRCGRRRAESANCDALARAHGAPCAHARARARARRTRTRSPTDRARRSALPRAQPLSPQAADKAAKGSGASAEALAEAAAALKRTPEEQAREEAKIAAKKRYEESQKAGEVFAENMRLAAGKVKAKGMTGSSLMKNRQAGKVTAKRSEKSDEEAKKEGESALTSKVSPWLYGAAAIFLLSWIGSGLVNMINSAGARPVQQQGPR